MRVTATRLRDGSGLSGSTSARAFAVTLAGITLIQVAWAVALPLWRGPDEIEHVKRASGVAMGEILADSVTEVGTVIVDRDVAAAQRDACLALHSDFDPTICDPVTDVPAGTLSNTDETAMRSSAARYNPAWYVLVVPASWLFEGSDAAWGMRAISGIACAIVLTWAVTLHRASGNGRAADTSVMLCVTPAVVFASIVAAPNGLHLASAVLFWVALLASTPSPPRTWALCTGAAMMSLTHALGVFWVICAVLVVVLLRGSKSLTQMKRELLMSPGALAIVLGAHAFTIAWVVIARTNTPTGGDVLADSTKQIPALAHGLVWVMQLVGTMPFRFGLLWPVVYVLWGFAFATFMWRAVTRADARQRLAMATVVTVGSAIPVVATLLTYEDFGYAWQGRYELPLLFALPLLAGGVVSRGTPAEPGLRRAYTLASGLAMGLAAACLALREGVNGGGAVLVFVLSVTGWWLAWGAHSETAGFFLHPATELRSPKSTDAGRPYPRSLVRRAQRVKRRPRSKIPSAWPDRPEKNANGELRP